MGAVLVSNEWNLRLEESVKFYGGDGGGRRVGLGGETPFPELTLAHTALKPAHVHPCDRAKQQGSSSSARDKPEQESVLFLSRRALEGRLETTLVVFIWIDYFSLCLSLKKSRVYSSVSHVHLILRLNLIMIQRLDSIEALVGGAVVVIAVE